MQQVDAYRSQLALLSALSSSGNGTIAAFKALLSPLGESYIGTSAPRDFAGYAKTLLDAVDGVLTSTENALKNVSTLAANDLAR